MPFYNILILFLGSTRIGFFMLEFTINSLLQLLCSQSVSNTLVRLSMKPLLPAQCALIGWLDQCVVIGQPLQVCLVNVMPLSISASFIILMQLNQASP